MATFTINGNDITSGVLLNTFNYMKRIDDVFGTGSFTFESETITNNISPYSVLKIDEDCFLCSSEATYHYGSHSWVHNVSTIEATSILSRFLVGTKAFSVTGTNTKDYEKIGILIDLMNQKYGVNIVYNGANEENFDKQIEYVFTAGTTLFDALNEIVKNYNYRIYVSNIEENNIYISHLDLEDLSILNINENKILAKTKTQNPETYCKFLETEANNVIDTTNFTTINHIYPTANDVKLSEDTFMLKLPTAIYKVRAFWANLVAGLETSLELSMDIVEDLDGKTETQTYYWWSQKYPVLREIYDKYYAEYFPNWSEFSEQKWKNTGATLQPVNTNHPSRIPLDTEMRYNLSSKLLSKERYDMIEEQNKPDYVYYTLGGNTIEGFNVFYKNDFWGTTMGESKEPFIYDMWSEAEDQEKYIGEVYEGITILKFRVMALWGVFKDTFGIQYYPLTNPIFIDEKIDSPKNETEYKPFALSYGKSSNYVDFDKLNNSIKVENQTTGKVEMIIEYDITGGSFMREYKKVRYNSDEWYVSNSQYKITPTQSVVVLNLVSNYNKVADIISLNSQYNTVKNPLQNIVERPIFMETKNNFEFTEGVTYFILRCEFSNNATKNLIFSPVILRTDDETYFYFEMDDQYSAGDRKVDVQGNDQVFKVEPVPYVDSNNELFKVTLYKADIKAIGYERAKAFPYINFSWNVGNPYQSLISSFKIYKDAREKLTFTIKANNCIIK